MLLAMALGFAIAGEAVLAALFIILHMLWEW